MLFLIKGHEVCFSVHRPLTALLDSSWWDPFPYAALSYVLASKPCCLQVGETMAHVTLVWHQLWD